MPMATKASQAARNQPGAWPRPTTAPATVASAPATMSESPGGCWERGTGWPYASGMAVAESPVVAVPGGHLAYRSKIRRYGMLMGLSVPVAALAVGALLIASGGSPIRGSSGFLLTAMAAPTMLLLGVPVAGGTERYVVAGVTSVVLWLAIGAWAARRATRPVVASWRDWWREYLWLAVPVWLGATVAFVVAYRLVL